MTKIKKNDELEQQIVELTADLQRLHADFENYRKRVDSEKQSAIKLGESKSIVKLLPVIDTIERAVEHIPTDISEHQWVRGVAGLTKQLDKSMGELGIERIDASPGAIFNPELHQAIQFDDGEGDQEVVAEELQAGYKFDGAILRPSMVRVTRR